MPVNDYSTTPGSNTAISGIDIAENCAPAGINNALRQVLGDIATWRAGSSPTVLFTGGGSFTGNYTFGGTVGITGVATFTDAPVFTTAPVFTDASGTRAALGAQAAGSYAASGANTDITALNQDVSITATGTIAATSIGYRGLPQNAQASSYTLVLADAGKHISVTGGGSFIYIPSNSNTAFPIGTTIVIYNNTTTTRNIFIATDTLRLAGTGTTGSRSLAQYGVATLVKVASTEWVVSGAGVS